MGEMIRSACKTEQQAVDALLYEGYYEWEFGPEVRCACGYTTSIVGLNEDGEATVRVAICENCGEDEAWVDDVVIPIKPACEF